MLTSKGILLKAAMLLMLAMVRVVDADMGGIQLENIVVELEGGEEVSLIGADEGSSAYLNGDGFDFGFKSPFLINDMSYEDFIASQGIEAKLSE